jgi:hypothetical protein
MSGASTSKGHSLRKRKHVEYDETDDYEDEDEPADEKRRHHRGDATADANAAARQRGLDELGGLWFNAAADGGKVHDLDRHKEPAQFPNGTLVDTSEVAALPTFAPIPVVVEHAASLPAGLREQARSILFKIDDQQGWSDARKVRGGGLLAAVSLLAACMLACLHACMLSLH